MALRRGGGVDELAPFVLANVEGLREDSQEAGHGAYGVIYNVTINGLPCVAKKLHKALVDQVRDSDEIRKKFRSECITLSRLKHPNIVHFIGVHYGKERSDLTLIMERLHSDLSSFLETHPQVSLPLKLSILLDVTYGLLYLHTHNPQIIHRDLTARNVLVTSDGRAKIADLGVAKLLTPQALMAVNKHTKAPGQPLYMPPEALTENPECTPKIDVFSFGHLSLFAINQEDTKVFEVPVTQIPKALKQGTVQALKRRPALEKVGKGHCLYPLITQCLHDNPASRPSTSELKQRVQALCTRHPRKAEDYLVPCDRINSLSEEVERLADEVEVRKHEAMQYKEDFERERKDRQEAAGRHAEEIALWQLACQKLKDDFDNEKKPQNIARLSDDLMAKTQQVKQYKKQVAQLQETEARMQEQIQLLQEQLTQKERERNLKACIIKQLRFEQQEWKNDKLNIENELQQVTRECAELKLQDRANRQPQQVGHDSSHVLRDIQAVPILTRASVDPNTLPQPVVQVASQEPQLPHWRQVQPQATQYPYHQKPFHPFQMRERECYQQPLHRQGSVEPAYQNLPQKPQQQLGQYYGGHGMLVGTNQGYVNLDAQVSPRQQQQQQKMLGEQDPSLSLPPPFISEQGMFQRGQNQAAGINAGQQLQNARSRIPVAPQRPILRAHSTPDEYQHYPHQAGGTGKTGLPQSPQPSPPNKDIEHFATKGSRFGNILQDSIDEDIEQFAAEVRDEVSSGRERNVTDTARPYDPNLVCPMCNKPFRIGEIQKFRTHVNQCEREKVRDEVSSGRERTVTDTPRPYDPNLVCPMCNKVFRIGEIQKFRAHVNQCDKKKKKNVNNLVIRLVTTCSYSHV